MTSTLDACFKDAQKAAENDIKARSDVLDKEETNISDQRARFEAEQSIEFYDELSSDKFAKDAPKIMQTFLSHGDACSELEAEALGIASKDLTNVDFDSMDLPLREFNDVLDKLGVLLMEAFELESAILRLTSKSSLTSPDDDGVQLQSAAARSQIAPIFSACLPIIRARAGNLAMAQQLVEGAKQNLSMSVHLESLGIGGDEGDDYDDEGEDEDED
ncbi:hypothetical protein BDP27DRAFT_1225546 [Rhodocollybia butyracea]|uniref:Uncharacterized protein n=1 Tax=Rhodocollybia butyracea TaxID=206335 RepID=A0A9P5PL62_9AGAR|nr:hypothetical protein BDP27DRAFT_1225546 [Rhodocollybia butyracea]